MNSEDAVLLRRYVEERSELAFAELVRRYIDLVYHAALRQVGGDRHRAEDVSQAVFTLLAKKAARLLQHQTLAGWLHMTTRLTARRSTRTEWRRLNREQEAQRMNESQPDSTSEIPWQALRPIIDDVLENLDERDRDAVLLRFFANHSYAQIGARMQLTENAARMRVERALEKLHILLSRRGVTSTTSALGSVLAAHGMLSAPAGLATAVTGVALAGGGALTASGVLAFAASTKFAAGVTIGATVFALGASWHEQGMARQAGRELVETRTRHAALVTREREAEQAARLAAAEVERGRAERAAAEAAARAAAPTVVSGDPIEKGRELLQKFPEVGEQLAASGRAGLTGRYYPLYRALQLNAAQIAELEDVLVRGHRATLYQLPNIGDVVFQVPPLTDEEKQHRVREIIGEDAFERFEAYQKSMSSYVVRLGGALYFTDTPLTPEQGWKLAAIFVKQANQTLPGKMTAEAYWDAIEQVSAGILSGPQQQAMRALRKKDEWMWADDQLRRGLAGK